MPVGSRTRRIVLALLGVMTFLVLPGARACMSGQARIANQMSSPKICTRVIVHVSVWQAENALTVPKFALFRKGDDGRQRRFGPGHPERVTLVRHCRDLGFPLDAIRKLLRLSDRRGNPAKLPTASRGISSSKWKAVSSGWKRSGASTAHHQAMPWRPDGRLPHHQSAREPLVPNIIRGGAFQIWMQRKYFSTPRAIECGARTRRPVQ